MVAITQSHAARGQGAGAARAPPAALKTVRPKVFRRASLTSWGEDNLNMTRAAAEVNLKELMLTVQQQKVRRVITQKRRPNCLYLSMLQLSVAYTRTNATEILNRT